jgi:putative membrane protein
MIQYDAHNWQEHLFDIKGSMVREIIGRVLTCVGWAALIALYDTNAARLGLLTLSFPETAHSLMGGVLGLLLVFRTNASYDRFWEGRKLWGSLVNECRNIARLSKIWLSFDKKLAEDICEWTAIFPWMVMHRLRGTPMQHRTRWVLEQSQLDAVFDAKHPSLDVARKMSQLALKGRERGLISEMQLVAMEACIQRLVDYLGGCERIQNTPMPFAYMVHLRRALTVYCFTLPFALFDKYHWGMLPIVLVIAYIMFGIEEIGVEIENPFGIDENDLPLERLCETIQRDVRSEVL